MGLLTGTMIKDYDLSTEIDHYSELSDKARAGSISASERQELNAMRQHLAI